MKSVERIAMAVVSYTRPADARPAERIKQLEAEIASLSASVQRLTALEKELVERVTREGPGNSPENKKSMAE